MAIGIERTRSELRTDFYDEAATKEAVISTAKVNELLQQAGIMLAWFVATRPDQRILYRAASIFTTANVARVVLPDNCLSIQTMRYTDKHNERREITEAGRECLDMMDTDDPRDWTNTTPHYVFAGLDFVEFDPVPEAMYEVRVHYIPSLPFRDVLDNAISRMTADTDKVVMPFEWHRYLVLQAVKMFFRRRKKDTQEISQDIAEWALIIQNMLGLGRQTAGPKAIKDVHPQGEAGRDLARYSDAIRTS